MPTCEALLIPELDPFGEEADPRLFFESRGHMLCLSRLRLGVTGGDRLQILSGDAGTGKTMLAQCLARSMDPRDRVAWVRCLPTDRGGMFLRLDAALAGDSVIRSKPDDAPCVAPALRATTDRRTVVIVDDARHLAMEAIRELADAASDGATSCRSLAGTQWVVVGGPTLPEVVECDDRWREWLVDGVRLNPLGMREVKAYIASRWSVARGSEALPFTDDALTEIAVRTAGIPGRINTLCRTTLATACADGRRTVEWRDVEECRVTLDGADNSERGNTATREKRATPSLPARVLNMVARSSRARILRRLSDPSSRRATRVRQKARSSNDRVAAGEVGTERSSAMTGMDRDADRPDLSAGSSATIKTAPSDVERNATGVSQAVETALVSRIETDTVRRLAERLEAALERSPSTLRALEQSIRRTEEAAERIAADFDAAVAHQRAMDEQLSGLVKTCDRAGEVQNGLTEIVSRLGEVGQKAQEKTSALRGDVSRGQTEREALERLLQSARGLADSLAMQQKSHVETFAREIGETARVRLDSFSAAIAERLAKIGIEAMESRIRTAIERAEADGHARLSRLVADAVRRFEDAADAKSTALNSQLQASRESVRMVAESTREAQGVLSQLIECQATSSNSAAILTTLCERGAQTSENVRTCLEGAPKTTEKIERLIQDVWTLTTTAQERARQLTERCRISAETIEAARSEQKSAETTIETVRSARAEAEATIESMRTAQTGMEVAMTSARALQGEAEETVSTLADHMGGARQQAVDVSAAVDRAEDTIRRAEEVAESASESCRESAERTRIAHDHVTEAIERADDAFTRLNRAVETAAEAGERIAGAGIDRLNQKTVEIEGILGQLDEMTTTAGDLIQRMTERLERGVPLAERLESATAQACASADSMGETLTRVQEAVGTSDRALGQTGEAVDRINEAIARSSQACERFTEQSVAGSETLQRMSGATGAAERLVDRVRSMVDAVGTAVREMEVRTRSAEAASLVVQESIEASQSAVRSVSRSIHAASEETARVAECTRAAEACVQAWNERMEAQRDMIDRADACSQRTARQLEILGETIKRGESTERSLAESTRRGDETGQSAAELLATVEERCAALQAGARFMEGSAERAEAVRVKLQQLQTKADAFAHQLNGMLSDPARIVEEARSQAGQLDGVVRAVRKVFAGLSRTSLQANQDVTRFAEVSRQAEARLVQLTSETQRASEMLREWVSEASHAQSRLSRTLSQAPAIGQSHPTMTLENLARSSESIPDVLKAESRRTRGGGETPVRPLPSRESDADTGAPDRRSSDRTLPRGRGVADRFTTWDETGAPGDPGAFTRLPHGRELSDLMNEAEQSAGTLEGLPIGKA